MTVEQIKEEIEALAAQSNKLQKEIGKLKQHITDLNKPKAERFRAKIGAEHLLIDTIGKISNSSEIGCRFDKQRHEVGNYYPDTAEGRARAERMAEIATVLRLVEHQPGVNWELNKDDGDVWYIEFDRNSKECHVDIYDGGIGAIPVPFESQAAAQAALEAVGEERILKALNVI